MRSELSKWLEDLGLGQYAEPFATNGIDFDLLPELTNEDLKDLGVTRLADRKRLLNAIVGVASPTTSVPGKVTVTLSASTHEAERRQLTVMFCDLVDSTALSGSLDPEKLRDVLRAYQAACAGVIDRYDGHIAKYIGDGLLVYFGIPRVHEDDAQRAVSAGLGIVEVVAQLSQNLRYQMGIELAVRVGVHTGLVVAGEMGAGTTREEMAIVGETPNIAARLQSLATPNAVVISSSTQRLVGGLFTYEGIGKCQLKGVINPIQVWRVTGEGSTESRFEALHPAGLVPFVGREPEMDLLLRRWEQAKCGEGQVVLLSGEAGIGKSRLIDAMRERIADVPHARLLCQCSAHFTNSALYPFAHQLEQATALSASDPPEVKLDKLERLLVESGQAVLEVAPFLANLLSIPVGGRYPPLDLAPQRMKERTLAAFVDLILGLAEQQPVLFIIEDAHWIDPSSEELISAIIDRQQDASVLTIITYRPDYTPPWNGAHLTLLPLRRLNRTQAAAIVSGLTVTAMLSREIAEQIVAKADGVPLFIEELTKTVIESGIVASGDGVLHPPQLPVPATLHDTLLVRLDRTAAMKKVAQTAAVLGREFDEPLLREVASLDEKMLTDALDELVRAGLLFRRGSPPQTSYIFKHALVQDAAYETLLLSDRQYLHARAAKALQQAFSEVSETQPELLARHYEAAGMPDVAISWWQRAGARAIANSNYIEAERQLTRAVAQVQHLAEDRRKHVEFDLQMALGAVFRAIRGSGSSQTERTYARARVLSEEIGGDERLLNALYGQFVNAFNGAKLRNAERYAAEFMAIGERRSSEAAVLVAHELTGMAAFLLGNLVRSRGHLEASLQVGGVDPELLKQYSHGWHPNSALNYLSWNLFALGYPEQARARAREAVAISKGKSNLQYVSLLGNGCYLHQMAGDYRAVEANLATLLELAQQKGIVVYYEIGRFFQGWTRAGRGDWDDGITLMRDALAAITATEQTVEHPYMMSILAETYLRAGRWLDAQKQLERALGMVEATDERWYEAELHRLTGEVALVQGNTGEAEMQFQKAIGVARAQWARMWELRAAKRLACLWREAGKPAEARELLIPVLHGFTEGFNTADVIEGKALLRELV